MSNSETITVEPVANVQNSNSEIWNKSVALSVTMGRLGIQRNSKTDVNVSSEVDQNLFRVTKKILDCEEYKKIVTLDGKIRNELRKYVLPQLFKDGVYLVPNPLVEKVYLFLEEKMTERQSLVDEFISVYDERKEEAKARLKEEFSAKEYPETAKLKDIFKFEYKFISFGVPDALKEISSSVYESERNKAQKTWQETSEVVQQALRESFKGIVDHLCERLEDVGNNNGEKKKFHASAITSISEFLEDFKSKNITNDSELEQIICEAKSIVENVNAKEIRTNETLRNSLLEKMQSVKTVIDNNLVKAGKRAFVEVID